MHSVTADQSLYWRDDVKGERAEKEERREEEEEEEEGDTAVSFSDHRMCIPGDNRVNVLGQYSVQVMRKRQTHCERQEQHFHHSPWERERVEEEKVGGHPSNSAQDRQTYRVLSMYSVHRINPQCVLTNITQLPPDWLVSVGEARSAPSDPRPQALELQHRHDAGVFPADTHSHATKSKLFAGDSRTRVRACSRYLMLSSEAGTGERRCRSYTIKLEVFG